MTKDIYSDIAERTDGDIYIGIVGPVRNRKIYVYQAIYGVTCNTEYRK